MSGVEKAIPDDHIQIGGKVRRLVANHWALAMMEKASGKSAMTGELFQNIGFGTVSVLLWGLLLQDPEVKITTKRQGIDVALELVSSWIEMEEIDAILTKCSEMVAKVKGLPAAQTEGGETEGKEQPAKTPPAGGTG